MWAQRGNLPRFFGDVLALWKEKAVDVRGKALPGGHFLAEDVPDQTLAELKSFLTAS